MMILAALGLAAYENIYIGGYRQFTVPVVQAKLLKAS